MEGDKNASFQTSILRCFRWDSLTFVLRVATLCTTDNEVEEK
jgi:hypothetical protein